MSKRMILPLIFGLGGLAILLWLGTWQLQRLAWKEELLAAREVAISAEPVSLPDQIDPKTHHELPVKVEGRFGADHLRILISQKRIGAGYRIISPFDLGGRVIMVDRGILPIADELHAAPSEPVTITGNLYWPDEIDSYTPDPDLDANIWFARDVGRMAEALGTAPVLLVQRSGTDGYPQITPLPIGNEGIPNDHLQYAVTWFALAFVWAGMTLYLLWRIRQRTV